MTIEEFNDFRERVSLLERCEQVLRNEDTTVEERDRYGKLRRACLLLIGCFVRRALKDKEDGSHQVAGVVAAVGVAEAAAP